MRVIAKQLRMLADWLDPPRNEVFVTAKLDASKLLEGLDMVKRRLKGPGFNGEIP